MRKTIIAAALAATVLGGGVALASQNGPAPQKPRGGLLMQADANNDGVVTRAEMTTSVETRFAKVDTNGDGTISAEERKASMKAMREKMAERRAQRGAEGAEGDEPGKPGAEGKPGRRGHPGMAGRMGRRGGMGAGPREPMTLDAQRANALKIFDFIDRNGDGKVDKAEIKTVHEVMMAMGGPGGGRGPGHHRGPPPPPPADAPDSM